MEAIGIRELRQHASRWLWRVQQGESFEVRDRDRPVALLIPMPSGGVIERLTAEGRLSEPAVAFGQVLNEIPPPPAEGSPSPSAVLARLREDER